MITELDDSDFQRIDQSHEREERRKRRQTKQKNDSVWLSRGPPKIDKSSFTGQPELGPLSFFKASKNEEGKVEWTAIKTFRMSVKQAEKTVLQDFEDDEDDPEPPPSPPSPPAKRDSRTKRKIPA